MYLIKTINNICQTSTNNFFTTDNENYQVLRDVDFMLKVNKSTIGNQMIQLRLSKKTTVGEDIIGDFYFVLREELLNENQYPFHQLSAVVNNVKQYIMHVSLSHYKSETSDEIEFFITHPNFTIKKIDFVP